MSSDEKYIRRGVFLALPQAFGSWEEELARMNAGKRGGQYEYPDSFLAFVSRVKDYTGMASRVLEGFLLGLSAYDDAKNRAKTQRPQKNPSNYVPKPPFGEKVNNLPAERRTW